MTACRQAEGSGAWSVRERERWDGGDTRRASGRWCMFCPAECAVSTTSPNIKTRAALTISQVWYLDTTVPKFFDKELRRITQESPGTGVLWCNCRSQPSTEISQARKQKTGHSSKFLTCPYLSTCLSFRLFSVCLKSTVQNVYRRTIGIFQRAPIFKTICSTTVEPLVFMSTHTS